MAAGKKKFIFFHIIGILIFLCLPVLFLSNGPEDKSIPTIIGSPWFWLFAFTYLSIFYLNAYWLFPKLYFKKQYTAYITTLLLLFALVYFIQPYDHIINLSPPPNNSNTQTFGPPPTKHFHIDYISMLLCLFIFSASSIIPIVKQWQKTQQQFITAQKDKANAELSFLKAQINPHFLFNTLNNLYSLSLTGSDKTPESIIRLSNIMRYVTDEIQNDFVLLENEIQCINDFIELQKLRLNSKTTVIFTYDKTNYKLLIAPLILLPFIENVFKHGISNNESSTIEIKIAAKQREIFFYCKNNIFNHKKNISRQGTGITNVSMRLKSVYPGNHFLKIEEDGKVFEVHLIINTEMSHNKS